MSALDIEVRLEMLDNHWKLFTDKDMFFQRRKTVLENRYYFKDATYSVEVNNYHEAKAKYKHLMSILQPTPVNVLHVICRTRIHFEQSSGTRGVTTTYV